MSATPRQLTPTNPSDVMAAALPSHVHRSAFHGSALGGYTWTWTTPAGTWLVRSPGWLDVEGHRWGLVGPGGEWSFVAAPREVPPELLAFLRLLGAIEPS